jgi:hypothetical protein
VSAPCKKGTDNESVSTVSLSAELVPDTGHDIALHPSASISFTMIDQWIKAH